MSFIKAPENTSVWVDTSRCKACDVCVDVCPAGVLSMKQEPTSILGAMISVEHPEACIGCNDCELSCPDFAIYVADNNTVGYKYAKLTDEAKARASVIIDNNYRLPVNYGK